MNPDDPKTRRNLRQEQEADYQTYTIEGSPADLGRQMAAHRGVLGAPALAGLTPEQLEFARACAEVVRHVHPSLLTEVEAAAEAYGCPVEEGYWFFSVGLTSLPRYRPPRRRGLPEPHETLEPGQDPGDTAHPPTAEAAGTRSKTLPPSNCSTVALLTPWGPVVGRNYDFFYWATTRHLITTRPEPVQATVPAGPLGVPAPPFAHTGMYDGVMGSRYDGLNSAGLFLSLHGVRSAPPARREPGLFCGHALRVVLDTCRTAREGADLLSSLPLLSSHNYLLADAREALVVEAHPERVRVWDAKTVARGGLFRGPGAPWPALAVANHFCHPDMAPLGRKAASGSLGRQMFLAEQGGRVAEEARSPDAAAGVLEAVKALLRDHGVPVCGHTDGLATFWSAVGVPGRRRAVYCLGAPCRNGYDHEVDFS